MIFLYKGWSPGKKMEMQLVPNTGLGNEYDTMQCNFSRFGSSSSNGFLKCKICENGIWKYNIKMHFEESHASDDFADDYVISDAERRSMMK